MSKKYMFNQIMKLYRSNFPKVTFTNMIRSGDIPRPSIEKRGKANVRVWDTKDLPKIGEKIGFLEPIKTNTPKIIVDYAPKGGVTKTTTTTEVGRGFALNNIQTLIVPLEPQASSTNALEIVDPDNLDNIKSPSGLYEVFKGDKTVEEVICDTDIPTLKYIPENSKLALLEQEINSQNKREYVLAKMLFKLSEKYVIIFDTPSHFGNLVKNALTMSTHMLAPFGCGFRDYEAITTNMALVENFRNEMDLNFELIVVRTLLDTNEIIPSKINKKYGEQYAEYITDRSIRKSALASQAASQKLSSIEYAPTSTLADDYYEVIKEIWSRVNG